MHDSYIRGGCIQSSDEKPANANWVWIALIFTAQRSRPLVYYCHSLIWPTECICTRFVFLRKCMSLSVCARSVIRMQWRSIRVIHDDVWRALASCTKHTYTQEENWITKPSAVTGACTSIVPCRMWSTSPFGREWHRFVSKNGTHSNCTSRLGNCEHWWKRIRKLQGFNYTANWIEASPPKLHII